ncbi:MAG: hypothetical protein DIU78_016100, partial [Pseudomonadota bacterium]
MSTKLGALEPTSIVTLAPSPFCAAVLAGFLLGFTGRTRTVSALVRALPDRPRVLRAGVREAIRAAVFAAARVAVTERSRRVVSWVVSAIFERAAGFATFRARVLPAFAAARAALAARGFVSARGAAFLAFLLAMDLLVCPRCGGPG